MNWWSTQVVPRLTHRTLDNRLVRTYRKRVCAGLSGEVLEIGFGSGLNLPHLPATVRSLAAVEPSDVAWSMAQGAISASPVTVRRAGGDAQQLDLPDDSVDAALCTFTLCTVPDPVRALRELHRVLRPGGTLHFLEHGLAPEAGVRRWQRRIEPAQRALAGGCHLTRSLPDLAGAAGFTVDVAESGYLPGPAVSRPWGYLSLGTASPVA